MHNDAPAISDRSRPILEGIARALCVSAVYNRQDIVLAPHILYKKHDAIYVDGVVIERDGGPPRELKLGAFKLDGLGPVALTDRPFNRFEDYDNGLERYAGTTLFGL